MIRARARGTIRHITGEMNKTEQAYACHLIALQRLGMVEDFKFEPMTLRLADNTTYRPDFMVIEPEGYITIVEVKATWSKRTKPKAGWEDDARVKWKVAAEMFPWYKFIAVNQLQDGTWHVEEAHTPAKQ